MKNKKNTAKNAAVVKELIQTDEEYNIELLSKMEKKRGMLHAHVSTLPKLGFADLAKWLKNIAKYNNVRNTMLIFTDKSLYEGKGGKVRVTFFTGDNRYHIVARLPNVINKGYLGCILTSRKSRVGEDWERGSDFPDGNYSKKTWDNIINRIIGCEMKNLQCWK